MSTASDQISILVVGNMGYVGPAVIRHLRHSYPRANLVGADVGLFAHCLTGSQTFPDTRLNQQRFVDIRDITVEDLAGFDVVIDLAAISNDPMGNKFENQTMDINCTAAVNLASMAKDAGARAFVFASSCSVYGAADGGPRKEEDPLNPLTAYARSKIQTEIDVEPLADNNFSVTCLRFPTACGMSDRLRLDLVLNDFVASALNSGRIDILSDGTPWRPLIDTNDMARAIHWALQRDPSNQNFLAINAGRSDCNYQIRDLAGMVKEQLPEVEVHINENAAPDKRSYQVDFSLYEQMAPEYLPQMSIADSIADLRTGLERAKFAERQGGTDFRNSEYIRLQILTGHLDAGRVDEQLRWCV